MNTFKKAIRLHIAMILLLSVSILYLSAGATFTFAQTNELKAHWRADGTATDASGNGFHGILIGGTYAPGQFGQAFSLDGVNDYISLSDPMDLGLSDFIVEGWFKTSHKERPQNILLLHPHPCTNTHQGGIGIMVYPQSAHCPPEIAGTLMFAHSIPADTYIGGRVFSTTKVNDGKWHHFRAILQEGWLRLYLNGNLEAEEYYAWAMGSDVYVGELGRLHNSSRYFKGLIDDIRIYGPSTNEPPEVDVDLLTESLWPPNHKMVKVADISATDDKDGLDLSVEVTSNEPINGPGDGNTNSDWEWNADTGELFLRAERSGGKSGRVYTVSVIATDSDGATDTESFEVTVPHSKKGRPKNIGELFAEDESGIPGDYLLSQNYPNPFNPTTEITFALPKAETVKLSIYNTSGHLIRTLVNGLYSEGFHTVMWNATDESGSRVTSGMYVYVLRAGETVLQNKMLLMK